MNDPYTGNSYTWKYILLQRPWLVIYLKAWNKTTHVSVVLQFYWARSISTPFILVFLSKYIFMNSLRPRDACVYRYIMPSLDPIMAWPIKRPAIIWTNDDIISIEPLPWE